MDFSENTISDLAAEITSLSKSIPEHGTFLVKVANALTVLNALYMSEKSIAEDYRGQVHRCIDRIYELEKEMEAKNNVEL